MSGFYMRGALVEMMPTFLVPLPNVIVFQYNPESITHAWTQPEAADAGPGANPLAVKGLPGESFTFTLAMDAGDMIADGSVVAQGIATVSGIYTRLAALEMLQFPSNTGDALLGVVSAAFGGGAATATPRPIPDASIPVVLFIWGPERIVPVRVTSLSISETLYDAALNPTHAEAQITLRVLTTDELKYVTGIMGTIANGAYLYSQGLRQVLALANLADSVESIIGMIPH